MKVLTDVKPPNRCLSYIMPFIVFAAPVMFIFLAYDQRRFVEHLLSSDTLLPAAFAYDATHFSDVLKWFQLPRVQSLFPDLALYFINEAITGNWRIAQFLYALLSFLVISSLSGLLISQMALVSFLVGALAFQIVAITILLIELSQTQPEAWLHFFLFQPVNHGGQFIVALCAIALTWNWMQQRQLFSISPLVVTLLSVAGALSDKLFFFEFLGPIFLAHLVLARRRQISWRTVLFSGSLSAISLGASLLGDYVLPHQAYPQLDWPSVPGHVWLFISGPFSEFWAKAPVSTLLCYGLPLLVACITIAMSIFSEKADHHTTRPTAMLFYALAAVFSVCLTAGGTVFLYTRYWDYRYTQASCWWPLIFSAVGVARYLGNNSTRRNVIAAVIIFITCAQASVYFLSGLHSPRMLVWRDPLALCLQELKSSAGLHAGLTEFWLGAYLTAMSNWDLQLEPISPGGAAVYWGNDARWFFQDIHDRRRSPVFDFILVSQPVRPSDPSEVENGPGRTGLGVTSYFGLPPDRISFLYGKPDKILYCPAFSKHHTEFWLAPAQVWIYQNKEKLLKTLNGNSLALQAVKLQHGLGVCVMPTLLFGGTLMEDGNREGRDSNNEAATIYGPYLDLPAGKWDIEVTYNLASDSVQGSTWSITADSGYETLLTSGLSNTGGLFSTLHTTFHLPDARHDVEFVFQPRNKSMVTVKQICISPRG
jgi:hypothetical protein